MEEDKPACYPSYKIHAKATVAAVAVAVVVEDEDEYADNA